MSKEKEQQYLEAEVRDEMKTLYEKVKKEKYEGLKKGLKERIDSLGFESYEKGIELLRKYGKEKAEIEELKKIVEDK